MGGMKRIYEENEAVRSFVIDACIERGFISCCDYHGTYLDQCIHSDWQSIVDVIKDFDGLEGYSNDELLSLVEEAMSCAGDECQPCRKWDES